eukprot:TRINITY_DN7958_c0_g1_i10.p1 TRINITY_DN7958_c0_g1~~TRINITY_DN7958_c0_g1_i10.p1  ORF type:complete len:264 (-),score=40.09 TRINITY_DN7958_c0_g1_i10:790-1581(-)
MQKPVLYEEKSGWYWHKSWNIPQITIIMNNPFVPENLYAQVFAAKINKHEKGRRIFTDIGLKGLSRKEIQGATTYFTGLKFITTSFHHDDNKFFLLVCVIEHVKDPEVNILKSFISQPIYVDSRKMAREVQATKVSDVCNRVEEEDRVSTQPFSCKLAYCQVCEAREQEQQDDGDGDKERFPRPQRLLHGAEHPPQDSTPHLPRRQVLQLRQVLLQQVCLSFLLSNSPYPIASSRKSWPSYNRPSTTRRKLCQENCTIWLCCR